MAAADDPRNHLDATKENADLLRLLIQREGNRISAGLYDKLHWFLEACYKRLPAAATVKKHADARLRKRAGLK